MSVTSGCEEISDQVGPRATCSSLEENKKAALFQAAPLPTFSLPLEPELRSNRGAQVIMSATIEKHVVADFQANPDRPRKGFNTAPRIQREIRPAVSQPHAVQEPAGRVLIGHGEIVESHLWLSFSVVPHGTESICNSFPV